MPLTVNNTQMMNKSCENYREVGESGANALNFDHISKLSWEHDQTGKLLKKRQQVQDRATLGRSNASKPRLNTLSNNFN